MENEVSMSDQRLGLWLSVQTNLIFVTYTISFAIYIPSITCKNFWILEFGYTWLYIRQEGHRFITSITLFRKGNLKHFFRRVCTIKNPWSRSKVQQGILTYFFIYSYIIHRCNISVAGERSGENYYNRLWLFSHVLFISIFPFSLLGAFPFESDDFLVPNLSLHACELIFLAMTRLSLHVTTIKVCESFLEIFYKSESRQRSCYELFSIFFLMPPCEDHNTCSVHTAFASVRNHGKGHSELRFLTPRSSETSDPCRSLPK